jgi:hypothetical protein
LKHDFALPPRLQPEIKTNEFLLSKKAVGFIQLKRKAEFKVG